MNVVLNAAARAGLFFGAVLVATCAPLPFASAALATTGGEAEVSSDGETYGPAFPGTLFGPTTLIPGGSETATLWVRNPTSADAYLRVALGDLVVTDLAFSNALSLRLAVAGTDVSTPLNSVDGCEVLANGVPLGAGDTVPITVVVSLGSLDGTQGQGGRADFTLGVTLSEVALTTPECTPPSISVPGTPGASEPPGSTDAARSVDSSATGSQAGFERGINKPFRGPLSDFNTSPLNHAFLILLIGSTLGLGAGWVMAMRKKRPAHPHPFRAYSATTPGGLR